MQEINDIIEGLLRFRNERNWEQFHNPKDLALALSIEAAELNEIFLWKNPDEVAKVNTDKVAEELADVFAYALMLLHHYNLDISLIVRDKMARNAIKYPVEKSRNISAKYTDL